MKNFYRWLAFYGFIIGLSMWGAAAGGISWILAHDFTYITFLIYIVFICTSVYLGIKLRHKNNTIQIFKSCDVAENIASKLFTLGMVGTVLGFMFMLQKSIGQMDFSNMATLSSAISTMGKGMSTALLTTLSGLVCGFLLRVQTLVISLWYQNDW